MSVASFFCAGLAREDFGKGRFTVHEQVESRVNRGEVVELIETIGAGAEFAGGLRAAEKKDAEQGDLVAMEIEDFREAMFELGDAAVCCCGAGEALLAQRMKRAADGVFVKLHYRVAIRFLIGRVENGVQGERVIVRSRDLLFDEGAEDAGFHWGQSEVHGES